MHNQIITRANGNITTDGNTISGYAIVYYDPNVKGTEYQIGPNTFERIHRSATKDIIRDGILATREHDNKFLLGRSPDSLTLWEDEKGIGYKIEIDLETTMGRDAFNLVRSKKLQGSSFIGRVNYNLTREAGKNIANINKFDELREISIVAQPAYTATEAVIRSINNELDLLEETKKRIVLARRMLHF